jgi:hypothetical protein
MADYKSHSDALRRKEYEGFVSFQLERMTIIIAVDSLAIS